MCKVNLENLIEYIENTFSVLDIVHTDTIHETIIQFSDRTELFYIKLSIKGNCLMKYNAFITRSRTISQAKQSERITLRGKRKTFITRKLFPLHYLNVESPVFSLLQTSQDTRDKILKHHSIDEAIKLTEENLRKEKNIIPQGILERGSQNEEDLTSLLQDDSTSLIESNQTFGSNNTNKENTNTETSSSSQRATTLQDDEIKKLRGIVNEYQEKLKAVTDDFSTRSKLYDQEIMLRRSHALRLDNTITNLEAQIRNQQALLVLLLAIILALSYSHYI